MCGLVCLVKGGSRMGDHVCTSEPSFDPCGKFSDTSSLTLRKTKGSIGHAFTVCVRTENQNQVSFYPCVLHEISVLIELTLGHLRNHLTDVPPQPNSQPASCSHIFYTSHLFSQGQTRVQLNRVVFPR